MKLELEFNLQDVKLELKVQEKEIHLFFSRRSDRRIALIQN